MSRFIDIDTQLGFKMLSVYGSIFYNIEQYTVHLSIHLAPTTPPPDCKSEASTGWESGYEVCMDIGGVDGLVFSNLFSIS